MEIQVKVSGEEVNEKKTCGKKEPNKDKKD